MGQCPHPMAKGGWQMGQEWNLRYVGITRAIEELIFVSASADGTTKKFKMPSESDE